MSRTLAIFKRELLISWGMLPIFTTMLLIFMALHGHALDLI